MASAASGRPCTETTWHPSSARRCTNSREILSKEPPTCVLDGGHFRGKLPFSRGTVVDFDSDAVEPKARPEDRLGTRWAAPRSASHQRGARRTISKTSKPGSRRATPAQAPARVVAYALWTSSRRSAQSTALGILLSFSGGWEGVLWLLRAVTRMATVISRVCRFLYAGGPGAW